jgi:hypothetical protein
MAGFDGPKLDPAVAVSASLDGIQQGLAEVVVDAWSAAVKASLAHAPETFYTQFS